MSQEDDHTGRGFHTTIARESHTITTHTIKEPEVESDLGITSVLVDRNNELEDPETIAANTLEAPTVPLGAIWV